MISLNPFPFEPLSSQTQTSATEQELLAQFVDIQLPATIGWWPLSWQLWLLILLFISIAALVGFRIYQQQKHNRYRKQILIGLNDIQLEINQASINKNYERINELLKRGFLAAGVSKVQISALQGIDWLNYLFEQLPEKKQQRVNGHKAHFKHWINESYQHSESDVHHILEYLDYARCVAKHHKLQRGPRRV